MSSPACAAKAATASRSKVCETAKYCPGKGASAPALLASSSEPVTRNSSSLLATRFTTVSSENWRRPQRDPSPNGVVLTRRDVDAGADDREEGFAADELELQRTAAAAAVRPFRSGLGLESLPQGEKKVACCKARRCVRSMQALVVLVAIDMAILFLCWLPALVTSIRGALHRFFMHV